MSYSQLMKQLEKLTKSEATDQEAGGTLHSLAEAYGFLRMETDYAVTDSEAVATLVKQVIKADQPVGVVRHILTRIVTVSQSMAASAVETAAIAQRALEELEGWDIND